MIASDKGAGLIEPSAEKPTGNRPKFSLDGPFVRDHGLQLDPQSGRGFQPTRHGSDSGSIIAWKITVCVSLEAGIELPSFARLS